MLRKYLQPAFFSVAVSIMAGAPLAHASSENNTGGAAAEMKLIDGVPFNGGITLGDAITPTPPQATGDKIGDSNPPAASAASAPASTYTIPFVVSGPNGNTAGTITITPGGVVNATTNSPNPYITGGQVIDANAPVSQNPFAPVGQGGVSSSSGGNVNIPVTASRVGTGNVSAQASGGNSASSASGSDGSIWTPKESLDAIRAGSSR